MNTRRALGVVLALVLFPLVSRAEVWNVGNDFSATQNPSGAWSYGWRYEPGSPLVLHVLHADSVWSGCSLDTWYYSVQEWNPCVMHNSHDYTVYCGYIPVPPNTVNFHPGPDKQCVVRWTAPYDMQVTLTAAFTAVDIGSSVVHVYRDGVELFVATLSGIGDGADFAATLPVQTGDVVDCAVDPISFVYDTVHVDINLETGGPVSVREPSWGQVKAIFR